MKFRNHINSLVGIVNLYIVLSVLVACGNRTRRKDDGDIDTKGLRKKWDEVKALTIEDYKERYKPEVLNIKDEPTKSNETTKKLESAIKIESKKIEEMQKPNIFMRGVQWVGSWPTYAKVLSLPLTVPVGIAVGIIAAIPTGMYLLLAKGGFVKSPEEKILTSKIALYKARCYLLEENYKLLDEYIKLNNYTKAVEVYFEIDSLEGEIQRLDLEMGVMKEGLIKSKSKKGAAAKRDVENETKKFKSILDDQLNKNNKQKIRGIADSADKKFVMLRYKILSEERAKGEIPTFDILLNEDILSSTDNINKAIEIAQDCIKKLANTQNKMAKEFEQAEKSGMIDKQSKEQYEQGKTIFKIIEDYLICEQLICYMANGKEAESKILLIKLISKIDEMLSGPPSLLYYTIITKLLELKSKYGKNSEYTDSFNKLEPSHIYNHIKERNIEIEDQLNKMEQQLAGKQLTKEQQMIIYQAASISAMTKKAMVQIEKAYPDITEDPLLKKLLAEIDQDDTKLKSLFDKGDFIQLELLERIGNNSVLTGNFDKSRKYFEFYYGVKGSKEFEDFKERRIVPMRKESIMALHK